MNRPPIQDTMKILYYLYNNDYIAYAELLAPLSGEYNVHSVEITDKEFTCYYDHDKITIWI